jgi:N-acetylmuramoyl-L-alanine amidase
VRTTGVILAFVLAATTLPRTQDTSSARVRTIVIDPGHGGDDEGARGAGGMQEKQLTLDVALRLRAMLQARLALRVVLTRENDRLVPLDERASIANAATGDLFLSLHANAAPAASVEGAEVYYSGLEPALSELLPFADEPLTLLPWEEAQARQFDRSARAAGLVQEELQRLVPMSTRSIRQAPLRVFRGAAMPAVLVEMLFLTNPEQEKAAVAAEFKDAVAAGLTTAVSRFQALLDSARP